MGKRLLDISVQNRTFAMLGVLMPGLFGIQLS